MIGPGPSVRSRHAGISLRVVTETPSCVTERLVLNYCLRLTSLESSVE
jgi:hypothetical protein